MELVKITYRFADGHVEELEVEQEVAETLKELDRQEYNNNQKESRRHVTFDVSEELAWLHAQDGRIPELLRKRSLLQGLRPQLAHRLRHRTV